MNVQPTHDAAPGALEGFIGALPKAELHLHLEGTLEPELMLALAERNGVSVRFRTVEEARRSYSFDGLQSFLDLYYEGCRVLLTEEDFHDLTAAYVAVAREQNVRHAEVFFDPQAHTGRGVPFEAVINGIHGALEEARREHGFSSGLILCFLRDVDPASAAKTLEQALAYRDWLLGVGLDSGERGHPPGPFADVFARAREVGLHCVAHAGEEGPAAYVREALDQLRAERIDHGVRALEDPALVSRLARDAVPLTVCPLSNVCLEVFPSMHEHNLRELLEAGLCVSVHSDDPAYFRGYINENYLAVQRAFDLTREQLVGLAANGFRGAFLDEGARDRYLAELREFVDETATG